jgi:hypothetical protein
MNQDQFDRAQERYDSQAPVIEDDKPNDDDFSDDDYLYGYDDCYEEDYE